MTVGEELKQAQDQKTHERVARYSDILRKFVKEDLLLALQTGIENGGEDYHPVIAPKEIRHLFAASLDYEVPSPYRSKSSAFYETWCELDEWAASEDLFIRTGHNMGKDNRVRPWADYDWGGSLGIRKKQPDPVKPTPPSTQKVEQGATITINEMLWGIGIAVLSTFLLTYFSFRP